MTEESSSFEASVLNALGHAVVVADTARRIVYWNQAAADMYGWTADEVLGLDIVEIARAEEEPECDTTILRRIANGETVTADYWMIRRDGTRFPVLSTITPVFTGETLTAVAAISTDITERREAEATACRLSLIVESSVDAIMGTDLQGRITSWNSGAERLYGYTLEEAVGMDVARLVPRGVAANFSDVLARWQEGERVELPDFPARCKDGHVVSVNATVSPLRDVEGNVIGSASIARDVTERKALEQAAEEDRRRLEEAQEVAQLGSFELSPGGTLLWSQAYRRLIGVSDDEPASVELFLSRVHPDEREAAAKGVAEAWDRGDGDYSATHRILGPSSQSDPSSPSSPSGDVRLLQLRTRGITDEEGNLLKVIGTALDVTELHRIEAARRDAEERFRLGFERGAVGTAMMDLDGVITSVNPAMCEFLSRTADQIIGGEASSFVHPDDVDSRPIRGRLDERRDRTPFERRFIRSDGTAVWGLVNLSLVRHDDGTPAYLYCQVQDISERKTAEQALEHMALHDPLTGLPNRLLLQDRLEVAMLRASGYRRRIAVVFGDIDRFKLVNDTLGHSAGDQLLIELAKRLEVARQAADTVGRVGGDEFVLMCEDVGELENAEAIGRRMSSAFDQPFRVGDKTLYVTVSCGVVLPGPGDTPATIFRDGDAAMYRAKELGRARTELFDKDMLQRASRLLDIESALRHAVENGQLRLEYQPIIDVATHMPVAVEALVRWKHPTRGEVTPTEFIPVAEQAGLIHQIGRFVLDDAVHQIAKWRRDLRGAQDLWVSVNLSSQQLSADLVSYCEHLVQRKGAGGSFGFEITESVLMSDIDSAIGVLRRLRELGIPVSIDDFGTGYSSLEYLQRLPVHSLKIDQSFVAGLGRLHDEHDPSIVRAVIALSKALGLRSCAEGVETYEQLQALITIGCELGQGYLWARPLSPEAFETWFRQYT
jgi:diguanylate cyclase (GGDEF)-like protein/PAS domain S-box-containing protein